MQEKVYRNCREIKVSQKINKIQSTLIDYKQCKFKISRNELPIMMMNFTLLYELPIEGNSLFHLEFSFLRDKIFQNTRFIDYKKSNIS